MKTKDPKIQSNWTGSKATATAVREQIRIKFGEEAAAEYNPLTNCLTYLAWQDNGYQVRKGEKALKSIVFIEKKDEDGEVIRKYPKQINLFYIKQVALVE